MHAARDNKRLVQCTRERVSTLLKTSTGGVGAMTRGVGGENATKSLSEPVHNNTSKCYSVSIDAVTILVCKSANCHGALLPQIARVSTVLPS